MRMKINSGYMYLTYWLGCWESLSCLDWVKYSIQEEWRYETKMMRNRLCFMNYWYWQLPTGACWCLCSYIKTLCYESLRNFYNHFCQISVGSSGVTKSFSQVSTSIQKFDCHDIWQYEVSIDDYLHVRLWAKWMHQLLLYEIYGETEHIPACQSKDWSLNK